MIDFSLLARQLSTLVKQDALLRESVVNLNASENYTSPLIKQALAHPAYDFYPVSAHGR